MKPGRPFLRCCFDVRALVPSGRLGDVMARLDVRKRQAARFLARGLTEAEADRFAARLGLHPGSVWSAWFEEGAA